MNLLDVPIKPHIASDGKINLPTGTYLKAHQNLDKTKYRDIYSGIFYKSYPVIMQLHTLTAYRVLHTLIYYVTREAKYELDITQKQLAEVIGCAGAEISKAIAELKRIDIVMYHKRGLIVVNPKYIWRGCLASQQVAVEESEAKYGA